MPEVKRRQKKTEGLEDNWKELKLGPDGKLRDASRDQPPKKKPKKETLWETLTRPHWTGEQARKRGLRPN